MGMLSSHGIAVRCIGCFEYLFSLFLPQEVETCGAGGAALVSGYTAILSLHFCFRWYHPPLVKPTYVSTLGE